MNRRSLLTSILGTTFALSATALCLTAAPAGAASDGMLTKPEIRKVLLTLPQISTASKVGAPMQAEGVACRTAPNGKSTVNYCYYVLLRSEGAAATGKGYPNHVDVISLASAAEARKYLKGLVAGRDKATVLSFDGTTAVFYDKDAPIATQPDASGKPGSILGPTVSVYSVKGVNVAYVACADPSATDSTALAACATRLAKAQVARIR
jgi:hypothetical protein